MLGIVAAKETRVDNDSANHAGRTEAKDREVMSGNALAPRFPPIHPLPPVRVLMFLPHRGGRLDEVLLLGEEVVVRVKHGTAQALGGEVDEVGESSHCCSG